MSIVFDTESGKMIKEQDFVYEILNYKHPFLRKVVADFDFNQMDANKMKKDFVATMKNFPSFGLSAPQVGIDARFFVMLHDEDFQCVINPEITKISEIEEKGREGCLSDMYMMADVYRPKWVMIKFQDENNETKELTFNDLSARIFLHEFDHLKGVLFTDKVKPVALKLAREKQTKFAKKVKKLNL